MNQLTTQEIVKRDPGVKKSGQDWRKIYYVMAKSIEANTHRVMRVQNTLFWLQLLPNNQVSYIILTADPPNRASEIMEEFRKALSVAELQVARRA
jgi:hypothetical protein